MKLIVISATIFSLAVSLTTAFAETIKIGGSGQMAPMMEAIANAYMKKNPTDVVEVNKQSLGQLGGVMAVNNGVIDIAMSARPLDKNEMKLPVTAYEFAKVSGVIAVNAAVPVKALTSRQFCDIYEGKIKSWKQVGGPDTPIVALTRPESDSTKVVFRSGISCFEHLKEGSDVISLIKAKDMIVALGSKVGSIGITDSVNILNAAGAFTAVKLDGKDMTSAGTSPVIHQYSLVLGKNRGDAVKRFLQFVKSPEGQGIVKKEKAAPVQFNL